MSQDNNHELPDPNYLSGRIPEDGSDEILLDLAAAASGPQPEFVQDYADRKALGVTAVDPLTRLELEEFEDERRWISRVDESKRLKLESPTMPRTLGDEEAEALVDYHDAMDEWRAQQAELSKEATMRTRIIHGLNPRDPGETDVYGNELEGLQIRFGKPKPIKPERHS